MSNWILHFQDGEAHIVVDSVAVAKPHPESDNEYPSGYTAKLRVFPQFGCVLCGRGDSFFMSMLDMAINRLPILNFDELCDKLMNVIDVAEMMGRLYSDSGVSPPMHERQEVLVVGYLHAKGRIAAKFACKSEDHPQYINGWIGSGTYCMTPLPDVDGRADLRLNDIDELTEIARRQLQETFKIDAAREGNQAGGHIIYACVSPSGISVKTLGDHANADAIQARITALPERRVVLHGL